MHSDGKNCLKLLSTRHISHKNGETHAFFDYLFVKNHGIRDQRWTLNHLIDNYGRTSNALKLRQQYEKHCEKYKFRITMDKWHRLRKEVHDGRQKLHSVLIDNSLQKLKMCLKNHKDMQRHFANMSIFEALERIDEQTFVLRRERDRLQYRVYKLEEELKQKLLERGRLSHNTKFGDDGLFKNNPEYIKTCNVMKNIKDSETRLQAIELLHNVYNKMIHVLRNDSLFYEVILKSLEKDIEDQQTFVTHIIQTTQPAIHKKKELMSHYDSLLENRQHLQKLKSHLSRSPKSVHSNIKINNDFDQMQEDLCFRYDHRTLSMIDLDNLLQKVEKEIILVANATFVTKPKDILPTIKHAYNRIVTLCKNTALTELRQWYSDFKVKCVGLLCNYPGDNFVENDLLIKEKIKKLQKQIEFEEKRERMLNRDIKRTGNYLTTVRKSLWNMDETLRHVHRKKKSKKRVYPKDYLNWPLLKYDHLVTYAQPPYNYETDLRELMQSVKAKIHSITEVYRYHTKDKPDNVEELSNMYQDHYAEMKVDNSWSIAGSKAILPKPTPHDVHSKELINRGQMMIPTNHSIKARSHRIVDEHKKVEEVRS